MKSDHFLNDPVFWSTLRRWWDGLELHKGDRAQLRRARTPLDVFIAPAFQRGLVGALRESDVEVPVSQRERLALPVGVLSHVRDWRESQYGHFAAQLATVEKGGEEVRDARFRKLITLDDSDALFTMLIRLTRFLNGEVHVPSLVKGSCYWTENTKRYWAKAYYTAS